MSTHPEIGLCSATARPRLLSRSTHYIRLIVLSRSTYGLLVVVWKNINTQLYAITIPQFTPIQNRDSQCQAKK